MTKPAAVVMIIAVSIMCAACSSSSRALGPLCRDGKRLADVAIDFEPSAVPRRQTEVLDEYRLETQLPGGHDVDYLSNDQNTTIFIYLRDLLDRSDRREIRKTLERIAGVADVQFGVLQTFGIREQPDACK